MTAPVAVDQASYSAAVQQLRAQIVVYAQAIWGTADLTDATVARLVGVFAPAVQAAQLQVANLTSVYLAAATNTSPLPVDDVVTLGRGTPPEIVYARPVVQARTLVSRGKSVAEAFDAGYRRLESLATTDLQMAKVRQADVSLAHAGERFYRRVPKGTHTCALCLIASTQRYRVGRLSPIHGGCDCDVDVIPPGMDLDHVINPELLEATHQKVAEITAVTDRGGRAPDYRKLVVTHQHGEMGDVLTWRGQKFTSLEDLNNQR